LTTLSVYGVFLEISIILTYLVRTLRLDLRESLKERIRLGETRDFVASSTTRIYAFFCGLIKPLCFFCVLELVPVDLLVQSHLSAVILGFTSTSPRYFDNK